MEISGQDAARLLGKAFGMSDEAIEEAIYHDEDEEKPKKQVSLGSRSFERQWHMATRRLGL